MLVGTKDSIKFNFTSRMSPLTGYELHPDTIHDPVFTNSHERIVEIGSGSTNGLLTFQIQMI